MLGAQYSVRQPFLPICAISCGAYTCLKYKRTVIAVVKLNVKRSSMSSSNKPRIRDYGIVVGTLAPGKYNAITDVPGVQVGHLTLIKGNDGER